MQQEHRNLWIMAGILVLVGLIVGSTLILLKDDAVPVTDTSATDGTEFSRPRLVGWSKGKRQWSLEARTMNEAGNVVTLERIDHGVIYRDEVEFLTFKAGKAVWYKSVGDQESSDLFLSNGVTLFKDQQQIMETTRLEWHGVTGLLVAPESVYFTYEGSVAQASHLTLNSITEEVILEGDIDLSFKDGPLIVVDGRLIYNMKTGSFRVEGSQHFDLKT